MREIISSNLLNEKRLKVLTEKLKSVIFNFEKLKMKNVKSYYINLSSLNGCHFVLSS
jgi:hypothetical protein